MITAGIDIGSLTAKAVILEDSKILSSSLSLTGDSSNEAAIGVMEEAIKKAGLSSGSVEYIVSTGAGKKEVALTSEQATEVMCDAKGVQLLYPQVGGVIDIGAESCRAIKCDQGNVVDFAMNDKCAAGTGIFLDAMAKALEVKPEEMGELSLRSRQDINITSMCAVFAESEVVSLIHRKADKVDILKGIHKSIATRVYGLANRIRIEGDTVVIGGIAKNMGLIAFLEEMMKRKVVVPRAPQIVGALGAAIIARERVMAK